MALSLSKSPLLINAPTKTCFVFNSSPNGKTNQFFHSIKRIKSGWIENDMRKPFSILHQSLSLTAYCHDPNLGFQKPREYFQQTASLELHESVTLQY